MPFVSKNKYKIFSWGKEYAIKEECIEKLKKLDSYSEFIFDYKPAIILPIIIVSLMINLPFFFIKDSHLGKDSIVLTTFIIYLIINLVFYIKLRLAINCKDKK